MTRSSFCIFLQSADGDAQTLTEVDLFISTQRIKVLNADSQVSTGKYTCNVFFSVESYLNCENNKCLKTPTELHNSHKLSSVVLFPNCNLIVDTTSFLGKSAIDCYLCV